MQDVSAKSPFIREVLQRAVSLIGAGDLQAAKLLLQQGLQQEPDSADALNALAVVECRLNDIQPAAHHIARALSLAPDDRQVVLNFVQICLLIKQPDAARQAAGLFLERHPEDADMRGQIAALLPPGASPESPQSLAQIERAVMAILEGLAAAGPVKVGRLYGLHSIGNVALGTDLFLRRKQLGEEDSSVKHVFVCGENPCNHQLLAMFKRHLTLIESNELTALHEKSELLRNSKFYYPCLVNQSNEYRIFNAGRATLNFTAEEEERGQQGLAELGIKPASWFVCVFTRDSSYKNYMHPGLDWSAENDMRNGDIDTFKKAIDYIVAQGGYVVRLGHKVAKPLAHPSERVIDYANLNRSEFMDIYLAAKCRFCLGMPSGICDVATIFDRPVVMTNYTPVGAAPWGKDQIYITKRLKRRDGRGYASFRQALFEFKDARHPAIWNAQEMAKLGYVYENNTDDEVLAATVEMLERLNGVFRQSLDDRQLFAAYRALYPQDHWSIECVGPIGRDFLRANQGYFFS